MGKRDKTMSVHRQLIGNDSETLGIIDISDAGWTFLKISRTFLLDTAEHLWDLDVHVHTGIACSSFSSRGTS